MKVLYLVRFARNDLLRAIGALTSFMTKWTREHDVRLHRVMQYLKYSRDHFQVGFIGDPWEDLEMTTFTDADFAGSTSDFKSTSGVFVALVGPHSFYPISALSNKQTVVSHSTTEAEVVAMDHGLRKECIPMLDLWEVLCGDRIPTEYGCVSPFECEPCGTANECFCQYRPTKEELEAWKARTKQKENPRIKNGQCNTMDPCLLMAHPCM